MDIITSMRIMTPQKTNKGNDYKHSNIGKYAGTIAGLATGGHFLYTYNKLKKDPKFFETIINCAQDSLSHLSEKFEDFKLTSEELNNEVPKFMKKFMNRGVFFVAAAIVGFGLGIGAISDAVANHFIKKHADKNIEK